MGGTILFKETKDFGYLLQHPNAAELITRIISEATFTKGKDDRDIIPDFFATVDLGYCKVSFDRRSEITRYRVYVNDGPVDFDDFAELVAYILSRWY